jgi:hypothetical protein
MLEKLLRAPLPEQIVALLEKLEQDPDTSHLYKVEKLLDYRKTQFTRYETWIIKRALRKLRFTLERAWTLEKTMSIVINEPEPVQEPVVPSQYYTSSLLQGAAGVTAGAIQNAAQQSQHARMMGQYAQQLGQYNSVQGGTLL